MGADKVEEAIKDSGCQCKSKDKNCQCNFNKQHRVMTLRDKVAKIQKPQTATKPDDGKSMELVSLLKMVMG